MARVATDPKAPLELRCQMLKELAQYVAPKRRALEVDATVNVSDQRDYAQVRLDTIELAKRLGVSFPPELGLIAYDDKIVDGKVDA